MATTKYIWDLLRMTLHPEGGGSVTLTYDREDTAVGDELMSLRRVYRTDYWPRVEVMSFDEDGIRVNVKYEDDDMNLFSLDIAENNQLAIAVGTPEEPATLELELWSFTLKVEEYDDFEEATKYFYVDDQDWENAGNGDPKAAQAVADAIAEQLPESLEIIARYMVQAAKLGSRDAIDWLQDYYHGDDGRFDAYV